ncbi:PLAC8 motif-containing protein [Tanacetum coccineum]
MSSTQNGRDEDEEANKCRAASPGPRVRNEHPQVNGSHTSPNNKTSTYLEFRRKLEWGSLKTTARQWIRNPMNMVLLVWILCVTISGAILFLVMTGMLNHALPRKYQREAWFEVNNQILNALFTLICLYHHPRRIHHLILLIRWRLEDITKLRNIYCKNGTYKPHERKHMLIVVLLLNLNCLAQYALCSLNVGYTRSKRPAIGVAITICVAIAAPAIAGVYTILSPLGKDYYVDPDLESQVQDDNVVKSLEKRLSFSLGTESSPKWSGGIYDFWDDLSIACLSLFCSFCVFGWNMERLGFGNMYVHTATFLLFCIAPFWIFTLAAVNIHNETVREALGTTGLFLCLFGLLYGGFWRIQMRKRYNLPPSDSCCGKPAVTDCALWLFCCWCSLAQEVRTGNSYDIVEAKFYKKSGKGPGVESNPGSLVQDTVGPSATLEEGASSRGNDTSLEPPFQGSINREGD